MALFLCENFSEEEDEVDSLLLELMDYTQSICYENIFSALVNYLVLRRTNEPQEVVATCRNKCIHCGCIRGMVLFVTRTDLFSTIC